MLTIFGNLRINDPERLQHMKDSFLSFQDVSDDWIINIRGRHRAEALDFLKPRLKERAKFFELLDDERGWMNNAMEMLPYAKHDYVLLWVEDHINLAQQDIYSKIVSDMKENNIDYLMYSWWLFGEARNHFDKILPEKIQKLKFIDAIELDRSDWNKIIKSGYNNYLVSAIGIFQKKFFEKLLRKDRWMLPMWMKKNLYRVLVALSHFGLKFDRKKTFNFLNKIFFFNKLPRFEQVTPFNLEKGPWRTDVLPLKIGLPRQELFACIDDDLGTPGYMLIKRGLYPVSKPQKTPITNDFYEQIIEKNNNYTIKKIGLPRGQNYAKVYYENENRTAELLTNTLIVNSGEIEFKIGDVKKNLKQNEIINFNPNLDHKIIALQNSILISIFSSIHKKNVKFK